MCITSKVKNRVTSDEGSLLWRAASMYTSQSKSEIERERESESLKLSGIDNDENRMKMN